MVGIEDQFANPRGTLGRLAGKFMARSNREINVWTVDLLDLAPDDCVLEIGTGPGVGIALAAERCSEGWVAGADTASVMLEQTYQRNRAAVRAGRVTLVKSDVGRLPFGTGSFSKAFSVNTAQVWPDMGAALREIRRVLRPGARLALSFQARNARGRAETDAVRDRFAAALERYGFDSPRSEETRTRALPAYCLLTQRSHD